MLTKTDDRTLVYPVAEPPATGAVDRDRPRHPVGAHSAALPARPHQRLPDRRRRRLGHPRHRHRQRRHARAVGGDGRGAAGRAPLHAPDRHALPPRPHRAGRMAVRALRPAAADQPDQPISSASTSRSAPARSTPSPTATSTCATASTRPPPSGSPPTATATSRWCRACRRPSSGWSPATRSKIGGRSFEVLTGNGHAPEQVMLYCAADNVFLAADQVLAKITPNISVWAVEPEGRSARPLPALAGRDQSSASPPTPWCCRATSCRSTACTPAPTS